MTRIKQSNKSIFSSALSKYFANKQSLFDQCFTLDRNRKSRFRDRVRPICIYLIICSWQINRWRLCCCHEIGRSRTSKRSFLSNVSGPNFTLECLCNQVTRPRQTEVDKLSGSIHCVSKCCRIFSVIKSAFVKKRRGVISLKNAVK